eukprot:2524131-Rhodomonas_salina.1
MNPQSRASQERFKMRLESRSANHVAQARFPGRQALPNRIHANLALLARTPTARVHPSAAIRPRSTDSMSEVRS